MIETVLPVVIKSVMITGFVFIMMLVIEYINVQTNGIWQNKLSGNQWNQYAISALLGAIPGCLGAFTVVALFSHRLVSFGALVAAMIATSGDEAFVMFVLFPKKALILTLLIFIIGIVSGYFTDKIYVPHKILANFTENKFPLHSGEDCNSFQRDKIFSQLKRSSRYRILLMVAILLFLTGISTGLIATEAKLWIKITLLISSLFSLFVVSTVPDHFLKKHLWEHIVIKHIPRIFFWTLGTLLVFGILMQHINIEEWFSNNLYLVLLLSVLAGIIPESGPHLIFVTLFAQGIIPFSILAASSIAQDGHGMLPLLAESKYSFVAVKIVNILVAFLVGTLMLTIGAYYKMNL